MAEHPNAALLRSAVEALNGGDFEQFAALLDDDVSWYEVGASEPIRGKAALAERMAAGEREFTIEAQLHDVVANDEHALAMINASATRGDETLEYRTVEILHMRDGKVTERWSFADDPQAIMAFFG